jgi:adenosylcobinamide-phosphate synthase
MDTVMPPETFPVLFLALLLDALFGYPDWLVRKAGHPVSWIGALIGAADRHLNKEHRSGLYRKLLGVLTLVCAVACAAGVALLLQRVLQRLPFGWIGIALLASTLLASRSLYEHVSRVADALDTGGTPAGRRAVSHIVGRDPERLDSHGVARAAIESLAENASDGVAAPAFWFALLGLPGLAAYKAINTADSMIGRRTPRHEAFGWAAARLDDLVNLPASRLTAALFVLAALAINASPRGAVRALIRDAHRHCSPNAGFPEAAAAGALGLKLAGPRSYGGVIVPDAYMGDGRPEAEASDIRRALVLSKTAWAALIVLVAALSVASTVSLTWL